MGKGDITRNYIIRETASLFNKKGYAGTSLSDLTGVLGLTKGALYGNFANKGEIALEALTYNFGRISESIGAAIKPIRNTCDKLAAFAVFYRDNFKDIAERGGCPALNAATDSDDGNPKLKKKVIGLFKFWQDSLRRIIARGIERGEIRKDVDSESFVSFFIVLIEGGIMLSKITGDRVHLSRAVDAIIGRIDADLRV